MELKLDPPIKNRSTEELFKIVINNEDWQKTVVKIAQEELIKRGFSIKKQLKRKETYHNRVKRISKMKAGSSMTTNQKLTTFLFGPIGFFSAGQLSTSDYSFKKIVRQERIYTLLGIILWIIIGLSIAYYC